MFKPFYQTVIIRLKNRETKLASGLFVPETSNDKEKIKEGVVVAVGKGRLLQNGNIHPMELKPGMRVLLNEFCGTRQKMGDSTYVFCKEEDVWSEIEGDAPLETYFPYDRS